VRREYWRRTSILRSRCDALETGEPKNTGRFEKINDDGEDHSMKSYMLAGAALSVAVMGWAPSAGAASAGGDWVGTWAASVQPVWAPDFPFPFGAPRSFWLQTVRQIARVSVGGSKVRVVLSNEYGDQALPITAAHVALSAGGSAIAPGSDRTLTFGGRASVTVPPGAPIVSDPVDLAVPALGSLAISLYFKDVAVATTMHWDGVQTAFIASGDHVADPEIKADAKITPRAFLSEILVDAPAGAKAVVTYGDSITDGYASTVDANHRWPDVLAERLQKEGMGDVAVVNEAISGERILADRMGANSLSHFDRDVIAQPHATTVVLMMGINDIGWPGMALAPTQAAPSADASSSAASS
jgi:GDSL-like lipase/acylhydrolase family protein